MKKTFGLILAIVLLSFSSCSKSPSIDISEFEDEAYALLDSILSSNSKLLVGENTNGEFSMPKTLFRASNDSLVILSFDMTATHESGVKKIEPIEFVYMEVPEGVGKCYAVNYVNERGGSIVSAPLKLYRELIDSEDMTPEIDTLRLKDQIVAYFALGLITQNGKHAN